MIAKTNLQMLWDWFLIPKFELYLKKKQQPIPKSIEEGSFKQIENGFSNNRCYF